MSHQQELCYPVGQPITRSAYDMYVLYLRFQFGYLLAESCMPAPGHMGITYELLRAIDNLLEESEKHPGFSITAVVEQGTTRFTSPITYDPKEPEIRKLMRLALRLCHSTCSVCALALGKAESRIGPPRCHEHRDFDDELFKVDEGGSDSAGKLLKVPFVDMKDVRVFHDKADTRKPERVGLQAVIKSNGGAKRQLQVVPENWEQMLSDFATMFPNFVELHDLMASQFALAELSDRSFSFPPILLCGDPGIGKTQVVRWLSKRLNVPFDMVDMATAQGSFQLSGSEQGWGNTTFGRVFNLLTTNRYANPLFLLDEVEKTSDRSYDPSGSLLSLLEKDSAAAFIDLSAGFPINASHVNWIATANEVDWLSAPIRSRFTVLHVPTPNAEQMRQIAQHIYQDMLVTKKCQAHFECELSVSVLDVLALKAPRALKAEIAIALGKAARQRRKILMPDDFQHPAIERFSFGFIPMPIRSPEVRQMLGEDSTS